MTANKTVTATFTVNTYTLTTLLVAVVLVGMLLSLTFWPGVLFDC